MRVAEPSGSGYEVPVGSSVTVLDLITPVREPHALGEGLTSRVFNSLDEDP